MVEKVLCKLQPTAGDTMIDLGCGDARWLIEASQRFGCKCVGIELDEALVAKAKSAVIEKKLTDLIIIRQGDIYQQDISQATIVVVYAFAKAIEKIKQMMRSQLPANARIVSVGVSLCSRRTIQCITYSCGFAYLLQFSFKGWSPDWLDRIAGLPVYVYTWPKATGGAQ